MSRRIWRTACIERAMESLWNIGSACYMGIVAAPQKACVFDKTHTRRSDMTLLQHGSTALLKNNL